MTKSTIAVIGGTGDEGSGLAVRWAAARHPIVIGSRSSDKADRVSQELNELLPEGSAKIQGATNAAAAGAGDIVVLSVPYAAQSDTIDQIAAECAGKILVCVTVPLQPPKVSVAWRPPGGSAAEEAQSQLGEDVVVVGAFQNIAAGHLKDLTWQPNCDILVTSNQKKARDSVIKLAEAAGFFALDAGPLANSSVVEGLTSLLIGINIRNKVKSSGIQITGIPRK